MPSANITPSKLRMLRVDNIPAKIDEAQLRRLFEEYGAIDRFNIIRARKNPHAFVKYALPPSASNAVAQLNGYTLMGTRLNVAHNQLVLAEKSKVIKVAAKTQSGQSGILFQTTAPKATGAQGNTPMPNPLDARQLEGKVAELQRELTSATCQHTLAVEALQRQHQAELKRFKAADRMTQRLIRQLSTLRLPTFSASKPVDNDKRMEEWIKSKEPSEAFELQVKEIRAAFQAAFPHGCFFYGSSSAERDSAMNDSDVDLAVVYPFALSLIEHLRLRVPLLTVTSAAICNPNCPNAVMYHWTYKDLEGEVVVFTDERAFTLKMHEIRNDPLSNLSERKTKGVKFMKRLRIAAFGGLGHPKSRVLTHVVHQVHLQEPGSAAGYSYTHYIPLYLDAFLKLSEANFPYYNRYNEAEWLQLKNVVRCVKRSFGLPLQPGELTALVEEDTRSSWL